MTAKELYKYLHWFGEDEKRVWIRTYEQDGTLLTYEFTELDISAYEDSVIIDCR